MSQIYIYINQPVETTRSARSLRSLAIIGNSNYFLATSYRTYDFRDFQGLGTEYGNEVEIVGECTALWASGSELTIAVQPDTTGLFGLLQLRLHVDR